MLSSTRLSWTLALLWTMWAMGCEIPVTVDSDHLFDSDSSELDNDGAPGALFDHPCPVSFQPVPLGTLGGAGGTARGLNNRGWVVGSSETQAGSSAIVPFIWKPQADNSPVGTMTQLPGDPSDQFAPGEIYDINDNGEVTGFGALLDAAGIGVWSPRSFYWSASVGIVPLVGWNVTAINNSTQVVGTAEALAEETAFESGFLWSPVVGYTWLPRLPGAAQRTSSELRDINEAGVAVGVAFDAQNRGHAVKYTLSTGYVKLPDFQAQGLIGGVANAINNRGFVVGSAVSPVDGDEAYGVSRAVLWEPSGTMHELVSSTGRGYLAGSEALDVNDHGLIVGQDAAGPWLWCGGQTWGLSDLIDAELPWVLVTAAGVNNKGQVAATGAAEGMTPRPVLLSPVFSAPVSP